MKNIIYLSALVGFVSFCSVSAQSEAVDGLGKVERLERLETMVTSLQVEIQKLKASLGASSAASEDSSGSGAPNFVRQGDLLTLKGEIKQSVEQEVREVKTAMARTDMRVENLARDLNEIKEGGLKDLNFKIEVLQKSLEALEATKVVAP